MTLPNPEFRRSWLFGADAAAHAAMLRSGADVVIVDFEDSTPLERRDEPRRAIVDFLQHFREAGAVTAVRINSLDGDGPVDLAAAMPARPDLIAYPMTN